MVEEFPDQYAFKYTTLDYHQLPQGQGTLPDQLRGAQVRAVSQPDVAHICGLSGREGKAISTTTPVAQGSMSGKKIPFQQAAKWSQAK